MKKKLVSALLVGTTAIMLAACGKTEGGSNQENDVKIDIPITTGDLDEDETPAPVQKDENFIPGFYLQTVGMPAESLNDSGIGLTYSRAKLTNIDMDVIGGYIASDRSKLDAADYDSNPTLSAYLEDDSLIIHPGRDESFYLYDKEYAEYKEDYDSYYAMITIDVFNFGDEDMSYKDCIENKWFVFEFYLGHEVYADDFAVTEGEELLPALIEKAGAPDALGISSSMMVDLSHDTPSELVYALFNASAPVLAEGESYRINAAYYDLYYCMDDVVYVFSLGDTNKGENYGYSNFIEVNDIYVVPKECVENFKAERESDSYLQVSMDDFKNAVAQ